MSEIYIARSTDNKYTFLNRFETVMDAVRAARHLTAKMTFQGRWIESLDIKVVIKSPGTIVEVSYFVPTSLGRSLFEVASRDWMDWQKLVSTEE